MRCPGLRACPATWRCRPPSPAFPALTLHLPLSPELHSKLQSSEAEVRGKREELSGLRGQLDEARAENSQLTDRIRSIEALLEASQAQDAQVSRLPLGDRRGGGARETPPALTTCHRGVSW